MRDAGAERADAFRGLVRLIEYTEEFDGVFTPKVGEVYEDEGTISVELTSYVRPGNEEWIRRLNKVAQAMPGSVEEPVERAPAPPTSERAFTEIFLRHIEEGKGLADALNTAIEEHRLAGLAGSAELSSEPEATETTLPGCVKDEVRVGPILRRPLPESPQPEMQREEEEEEEEAIEVEAEEVEVEEKKERDVVEEEGAVPRRRERTMQAEVGEGELPPATGDELELTTLSSIMKRLREYEESSQRHEEVVNLTKSLPRKDDGDKTLLKVAKERGKPLSLTELYAGLFDRGLGKGKEKD